MNQKHWVLTVTTAAVSAGLALGLVTCAWGQQTSGASATNSFDSTSYDRGRNVGVLDRPRQDYQAIGIHAGGFMIFPKAQISTNYDSNIYALANGAIGDVILTEAPEIDLQSTWSRNAVSAYVKAQQDWYVNHGTEDGTQYGGGAAGRFDFGDSTLTAGVDSGRFLLPRSVSNNVGVSERRIPYVSTSADVQLAHEFTRFRFSARIDYQDYVYDNGRTAAGAVVFERDQNRHILTYSGKGEFALTPDAAVYVRASGNDRRFDLNPPTPGILFTRNSDGYEVDLGASFDLSHLVRGEIEGGYLRQDYKSPLFKTISGPSALVKVDWFPTQLTTVTVQGSRSVGDSGIIGSAGFLASNGSIQIDHELLRNVILTANASIGYDEYNGVKRTDDLHGAGVSANWLLNHAAGITFAYAYSDQRSTGPARGLSYSDNRISITATLQY